MSPIFPELPKEFGVYRLERLIHSGQDCELYEATQTRVMRTVLLEIIRPAATREQEAAFLESARLRANSSHLPHLAQVLETLRAENLWFITQECPNGTSLQKGKPLTPRAYVTLLAHAAELYGECHRQQLAALPLAPHSIYVGQRDSVQFLSPIIPGSPSANDAPSQLHSLLSYHSLIATENDEEQQKISTFVQWLNDVAHSGAVDWNTIHQACLILREQFAADTTEHHNGPDLSAARQKRQWKQRRRKGLKAAILVLAAGSCIFFLSSLGHFIPLTDTITHPVLHEGLISCRRGVITQRVMQHPVSVQDYARFLTAWENMPEQRRAEINHNIPKAHHDHIPAEWTAIQEAAQTNANFHGTPLSPQSPITGISYWDALAYARYKKAELPDAALLQSCHSRGASSIQEWTSTTTQEALPGIYQADQPLALDMAQEGRPIPLPDFNYHSPRLGFRIVFTLSQE